MIQTPPSRAASFFARNTGFEKLGLRKWGEYSKIQFSFVSVSAQNKAALVGEIAVPCTRNPLKRG